MFRALVLVSVFSLGCAGARVLRPPSTQLPGYGVSSASRVPAPSTELSERLDRVARAFAARNAHPLRERWVTFLTQGADDSFGLTLTREQCVGFVGVGLEHLENLDLRVINTSGVELVRDGRMDAHPYVRVCGRAGDSFTVNLVAVRGVGEAGVLTVSDAPVVSPPLTEVLGDRPRRVTVRGRRPRGLVGDDPSVISVETALGSTVAPFIGLGYRAVGPQRRGRLPGQRSTIEHFELASGRCYLVLGQGGDNVDDLDLRVYGPDRIALAQDFALDAHPAVRFCARTSGIHSVEIRMYAGSGEWGVAALEIPVEGAGLSRQDIQGTARARVYEFMAAARGRGMHPVGEPVRGAGWLGYEDSLPMTVIAGRCYTVSAAPTAGLPAMDLWLARQDGGVLAQDVSARESAEVSYCPSETEEVTVRTRVGTARGEWVLQAFESGSGQ